MKKTLTKKDFAIFLIATLFIESLIIYGFISASAFQMCKLFGYDTYISYTLNFRNKDKMFDNLICSISQNNRLVRQDIINDFFTLKITLS